jgi:hypothetical protein
MDPSWILTNETEPLPEEVILLGDTILSYEELAEERDRSRLESTSTTSLSESQQKPEKTVRTSIKV